jgi:hypothetical protein
MTLETLKQQHETTLSQLRESLDLGAPKRRFNDAFMADNSQIVSVDSWPLLPPTPIRTLSPSNITVPVILKRICDELNLESCEVDFAALISLHRSY